MLDELLDFFDDENCERLIVINWISDGYDSYVFNSHQDKVSISDYLESYLGIRYLEYVERQKIYYSSIKNNN